METRKGLFYGLCCICVEILTSDAVRLSARGMPVEDKCKIDALSAAKCVRSAQDTTDEKNCGCFKKKLLYNSNGTVFELSTAHDACIVSFAGEQDGVARFEKSPSSALKEWINVNKVSFCGMRVGNHYVEAAKRVFNLPEWKNFAKELGGSACSKGVTVGGYSLGGSLAQILAACANSGNLDALQPKGVHKFKVDKLYTFGSPAISSEPARNALRADGCFGGERVFFGSKLKFDFATMAIGLMGVHPRQATIQITERNRSWVQIKHPCQDNKTTELPSLALLRNFYPMFPFGLPDFNHVLDAHSMYAYEDTFRRSLDKKNVISSEDEMSAAAIPLVSDLWHDVLPILGFR
eukprot:gnl/TRDRNA2_/TRDRNA2_37925_c0_seq1.p1 gnl/TRDRNA2_/TRDRNA2_37925_c0~~gnl/TRDRNA2_/TRDRNA2_37925_c0_seq1.p1  ORF type:complete len:350 (+),score=55.22 gnl/TRDRNA2_/TRDRNA2_37925_c0_seq1:80-1129(+)